MAAGVQVFQNGVIILDTSTRMGSFFGSFLTGGAKTGGVTIPQLAGRDAIYLSVPLDSGIPDSGGLYIEFIKSSGRLNWDTRYSTNTSAPQPSYRVIYGAM